LFDFGGDFWLWIDGKKKEQKRLLELSIGMPEEPKLPNLL